MSMNKKVRVQAKGGQVFLEGDAFYVLFGVSWFWAILQLGIMSGSPLQLTWQQGLAFALCCLPMALGGYFTAIAQARCAAAGVALVAKRADQLSKGIMMAVMVEFYAILCLLASFLMILFLTKAIG